MKEKTKMICIKVSPKEIEGIHKRMELAGVRNMSAYLLKMALNGYIVNLDLPEINEILRLLKISSNNLNQYARKANETSCIYLEDIKELEEYHKELLSLMGNVLDSLAKIA